MGSGSGCCCVVSGRDQANGRGVPAGAALGGGDGISVQLAGDSRPAGAGRVRGVDALDDLGGQGARSAQFD